MRGKLIRLNTEKGLLKLFIKELIIFESLSPNLLINIKINL
jgi:hypothetical protein